MSTHVSHHSHWSQHLCRVLVLVVVSMCALSPVLVLGQSPLPIQNTSKASDLNLRSNLRVNPSTHAVEFALTLGNYPGRGGLAVPITLNYSSKVWRLAYESYTPPVQIGPDGQMSEDSTQVAALYSGGWTSNIGVPVITHEEESNRYSQFGLSLPDTTNCDQTQCYRIDRMMIRMPDNAVHELRSSDQPYQIGNGFSLPSPVPDDLYAVDGSGLRFQRSTQTLFMPDGSRYIISNTAPRFIDRNGNTLTFNGDNAFNIQNNINIGITDMLGRSIPAFTRPGLNNTDFSYLLPGLSVPYTIKWRHLSDPQVMATTQPLHYVSELGGAPNLFSSDTGSRIYISDASLFNPLVLHQIVLPTGQAYTFQYNAYGEVEKLNFPGGGYERYEYASLLPITVTAPFYSQTNRGVTKRYVSSTGSSVDEVMWSYGYTGTFPYGAGTPGSYVLSTTAPDGSLVERYIHTDSLLGSFGYDIDQGKAGMIYDERHYSAPDVMNTRRLLQRKLTEWVTTGSNALQPQAQQTARRNARVAKEVAIVLDTGTSNALAKTTIHTHDLTYEFTTGAIQKSVAEYDWAVVSQSAAQTQSINSFALPSQPLRTVETTNLLLDPSLQQVTRDAYRERHLISLQTSSRIKNGSGNILSQTSIDYDEYSLTTVGPVAGWTDPQTSIRGNVTTIGRWLNTNGSELQTHSHFDQFGNVRTEIDAKGNQTLTAYASNHAYPATVTTAVPDPTGQFGASQGFTASTTYDPTTGLVLSQTDVNGHTTSLTYNDPLNRLTQVTQPNGAHINYTYSDLPGDSYIKILADLDSSRTIETRTYFDGLGRAIRNFLYDGTASAPWVVKDTYFDALGRANKVSSPYRVAGPSGNLPANCSVCTTTTYDELSRLISVTTADNSTVTSSYGGSTSGIIGTTVLVTDQAGKTRQSITDAAGRLIAVFEDPAGLNYQTTYAFDVLDNLTTVAQDSQTRNFVYDSLSRLRSATNPESGTTLYQYDDNGNLSQKTDARGIVSVYAFDALNRNIKIDYSDTAVNPDVSRIYDGAIKGKGRIWTSYAGGNESAGSNVDKTVVAQYDEVGHPLVQRQLFKLNGTWSPVSYETSLTYNLAGAVTSQTYPSGHVVSYGFDAAGRQTDVSGNLGDGNGRTYSTGIIYTAAGQMKQEQFGTSVPVYNKLSFNSRQQLSEILVSTTGGDSSWNRGKILNQYSLQCSGVGCNATDNNGNLRKQEVYIPGDDQVSSYVSWYQQYDYDELNRLQRVREYTVQPHLANKEWQQEFQYDRFGNRTIDTLTSHTYGTGINNAKFDKELTTNRLYADGDLALPENSRRVRFDAAGNQIKDTYMGAGNAIFDAENRITAIESYLGGWSNYTYNAEGQRTRRKINNQETWQIFGFAGELLAEYSSDGVANTPKKEYGYRNGQMLVTAGPQQSTRKNFALRANGGSASASSEISAGCSTWPARGVIDGDRKGSYWGSNGGWADSSSGNFANDWLQVDFDSPKTIDELDIVTLQDNYANPSEPTEAMTFSTYGLTAYSVAYWNGSAWINIPEASVVGNNKVWRKFTFAPVTTTKIRVLPHAAVDNGFSRLTEVEAWGSVTLPAKTNVALRSNGGVATASSEISAGCDSWPARGANDGDRKGAYWGGTGGWADSSSGNFTNDWLQVDFNGSKTIDEIDLFTLQNNYANPVEPTENTTFSTYGLTAFDVSYWDGASWVQISSTVVSGNNKVWRKLTFDPVTTTRIRVYGRAAADNGFSRIAEIEVWSPNQATSESGTQWLVTDQLGTPRMVLDQSGALANIRRHDYLPFGEELTSEQGLRYLSSGYSGSDGVRQQFTSKERDIETGLDYFLARYYSSTQGRFTSPDELKGELDELYLLGTGDKQKQALPYAEITNPQSINKYSYTLNNPLRYVDPDGHDVKYENERLREQFENIAKESKTFADELVALNDDRKIEVIVVERGIKTNNERSSGDATITFNTDGTTKVVIAVDSYGRTSDKAKEHELGHARDARINRNQLLRDALRTQKNRRGPAEQPHAERPEEKRANAFMNQVEIERKQYSQQQQAERRRQKQEKKKKNEEE